MEKIHIISVVFLQHITKNYHKIVNLNVFSVKKSILPLFIINNQTIKRSN